MSSACFILERVKQGSKFIILICRGTLKKTYLVLEQRSDCKSDDLTALRPVMGIQSSSIFPFKVIILSHVQGSHIDSVIQ